MTNIQWRRLADALEDNGGNEGGQDDYYDDAMDSQLLTSRGKEVRACTQTEGQNLSIHLAARTRLPCRDTWQGRLVQDQANARNQAQHELSWIWRL